MPRKIAVIGAGVMGLDIALEYVLAGFEVLVFDRFEGNPDFKKEKQDKMWRLLFLAMKDKRHLMYPNDEALETALARVSWFDSNPSNFGLIAGCEAVIEAIFEDVEIKHKLIRDIESVCDAPIPFLTNTSTLTVKLLAEASKRPENMIGFHLFNPVRMMKFVEVIPHDRTDGAVVQKAGELATVIGKKFELVPDLPGFVVNRLLLPMLETAGHLFDSGADYREIDGSFCNGTWAENPEALKVIKSHISAADSFLNDQINSRFQIDKSKIDEVVRLGTNFPAGPFGLKEAIEKGETKKLKFYMGPARLCDLVGIDVAEHCFRMLRLQEPNRWSETPEILKRFCKEKRFGKKTGKGFFSSVDVGTVKMANGRFYGLVTLNDLVVSHGTIKQINSAFESLRTSSVEAVVFEINKCRGADISEFPLAVRNPDLAKEVIGDWHSAIKNIINFPEPVIAVVRGVAWGGGYELAQACDYIIAEKGTKLSQPEVLLGIMPGGGGTQNLTRRVSVLNSLSMILDPKMEVEATQPWVDYVFDEITQSDIENIVSECFEKTIRPILRPMGRYAEICEAAKLRERFIGHPPLSFDTAVWAIVLGNQMSIGAGLALEEDLVVRLFENSADSIKEGIRARLERRDPAF